jgi:hypothetical protein
VNFRRGVTNMWLVALVLGICPQYAPQIYVGKFIVLMAWRWYTYRKRKWHYFLLDM